MYEFIRKFNTEEDLIMFIFGKSHESPDYFIGMIDYIIMNRVLMKKQQILKLFYYYCCENDFHVLFKKLIEKYNFKPHWYSHSFIEYALEKESHGIVKIMIYDRAILCAEYSTLSEEEAIQLDEFSPNDQFDPIVTVKNNRFFKNLVLQRQLECINCLYRQYSVHIIHKSGITSNLVFCAIKQLCEPVLQYIVRHCNYSCFDIYYTIHRCLRSNLEDNLRLYIDILASTHITFPIKILFIGECKIIDYILDHNIVQKPCKLPIASIVDIHWTSKFGKNQDNRLDNSIPFIKFALKHGYVLTESDLKRLLSIGKHSFVLSYLKDHPRDPVIYKQLLVTLFKQTEWTQVMDLILYLVDKLNIAELFNKDVLEHMLNNVSISKRLLLEHSLDINMFDGYILRTCINMVCYQQTRNVAEYIEFIDTILELPNVQINPQFHFTRTQYVHFLRHSPLNDLYLYRKVIGFFRKHNYKVWRTHMLQAIENFFMKHGDSDGQN